jgi:hypothetical protein
MRNTAVQSKRKIRLSSALVATYAVGAAAIAYNGSNKVRYVCSSHGEMAHPLNLIVDPHMHHFSTHLRMTTVKSVCLH